MRVAKRHCGVKVNRSSFEHHTRISNVLLTTCLEKYFDGVVLQSVPQLGSFDFTFKVTGRDQVLYILDIFMITSKSIFACVILENIRRTSGYMLTRKTRISISVLMT